MNAPLDLDNVGPEIKSYIYQTISEFEPFTTPETVVMVIAKDPLKSHDEVIDGKTRSQIKSMYRIGITLQEGDAKIEDEAIHENIYEAIRIAKERVLKILGDIQDSAISSKERASEINSLRQNTTVH